MTPDRDRRDRGALFRARLRSVALIAFTCLVIALAAAPTDPYI